MSKIDEVKELLKRHCFLCEKEIIVLCGTPTIHINGCCVGFDFAGARYLISRYAHMECFLEQKHKKKLWVTEKELKKKWGVEE